MLPETAKRLKEKFPRSNFQSTSERAGVVINEILTVLLPAIPRFAPLEPWEKIDNEMEKLREMAAETHMAMAIAWAEKLFEEELNLRERLDAMVARQVKNLVQLKAMKQMLRQTSALREDEPPKRIAAWRRERPILAGRSVTVSAADDGTQVNVSLDASALAALVAAEGKQFAVGGSLSPATVTPLPAALPLFATGLGGLGLLGWRRKRKAQAVA